MNGHETTIDARRPSALVTYDRCDRVGVVTLNRPEKHNALSDDVIRQLHDALVRLDDDPHVSVGVLGGAGPSFCSGADVLQRQARTDEEIAKRRGLGDRDANVRTILSDQVNHKPIVAALHGFVLGAGLRLALHCDLMVADPGTVMQVTEVERGVDGGAFWLLIADKVGQAFADDICLTARRFSGQEARDRGLIARLAPDGEVDAAAMSLAQGLAALPAGAVRAVVRHRRRALEQTELTARMQYDHSLAHSKDFKTKVAEFLDRSETRSASPSDHHNQEATNVE